MPHLWPLISRILGLGSFKSATDPSNDNNGNRFTIRNGKVVALSRSQTRDRDFKRYLRSESEERIVKTAGAAIWAGKGVGSPSSRDDVEMAYVDGGDHHKGAYAATVEAGCRRTCDEEEGVWGAPTPPLLLQGGGGEGIVKTVHLNQYAE